LFRTLPCFLLPDGLMIGTCVHLRNFTTLLKKFCRDHNQIPKYTQSDSFFQTTWQ